MSQLLKAVMAGRINNNTHLYGITLSNCTGCGVIPYATALDRISAAAGANLDGLKDGDPWGNPYRIDENEGEGASPCANQDTIRVTGQPTIPVVVVPFFNCP
jgi:hypothetical protein